MFRRVGRSTSTAVLEHALAQQTMAGESLLIFRSITLCSGNASLWVDDMSKEIALLLHIVDEGVSICVTTSTYLYVCVLCMRIIVVQISVWVSCFQHCICVHFKLCLKFGLLYRNSGSDYLTSNRY